MNKQQLFENHQEKTVISCCVGLDTDIKKIPEHLLKEEDPIFAFNKAIIDATAPYCIAYKPNLAFYESMGVKGWISFEKDHPVSERKAILISLSLLTPSAVISVILQLCMHVHSSKKLTWMQLR